MELIVPIIEGLKCMGAPTFNYIKDHRKLEEYVNDLRRSLNGLTIRREDVESRINSEVQWGKVEKKEVEKWLKDVEQMNAEMQLVEQKLQLVSYFSRARLGKKVRQKIKEVKEIYKQGTFPEGLVIDRPPTAGVTLPTTKLVGETTVQGKIWEHLMGNDFGMIGVCGMGGIGKTTIMKQINNQLLQEAQFDKVIWVTVSKEFSLTRLQQDIARAVGKHFPVYGDTLKQAAELMDIFRGMRYVLILDDVWEKFSLEDVGIPKPTSLNGCKIVITSRSVEVCRFLDCQVVRVLPLSMEESLNLFLEKVGHRVLQIPTLKETLKLIVEECAGLPLAIITIAGSLRGVYDVLEWRNSVNELRERVKSVKDSDKEIFQRLKFSYDRLDNEKIKNCFLYCSLYPEDYEIPREELIEDWVDEEFIDELDSRQAMYDRGHAFLNKLENNCLLQRTNDGEGVKMHDVVRDMALHITSFAQPFMVKAGVDSEYFPGEREWKKNLEKVSLMNNNFAYRINPVMSPNCPLLSTLLFRRNYGLQGVPDSFLEHMCGLKILDLSFTEITDLPSSISNLENLTALVLSCCFCLSRLPSLAKLRALKKLDLRETMIKEVPHGMEMLVNLRYLDLNSRLLKELPAKILPRFSYLQYLVLNCASHAQRIKGEEAATLRKLEMFEGQFYDLQNFNTYINSLQGRGPSHYLLVVGGIPGEHRLVLPSDLQELRIYSCHQVKSFSDIFLFQKKIELRYLDFNLCEGVECVLDLHSVASSHNSLQKLEHLSLTSLPNLRALVKMVTAAASLPGFYLTTSLSIFSSLQTFSIVGCPSIKQLFLSELLQDLQNLVVLEVCHCEKLEEIIASADKNENHQGYRMDATITINLPKLRNLRLVNLPELKSICVKPAVLYCYSLEYIGIKNCPKLRRIPLYLPVLYGRQPSYPPSLERITIEPTGLWESLEWDDPSAKTVLQPFVEVWTGNRWINVEQSTCPNQDILPYKNQNVSFSLERRPSSHLNLIRRS